MKLYLMTVILAGVLIAGVAATYFFIQTFLVADIYEIKMDVKVIDENRVGVTVDTDALHFGKVPREGAGMRNITLDNNDARPHLVKMKAFGNISQFIYVSENDFVMEPKESRNVTVTANPSSDVQTGYYEGTLQIIFMNMW